MIYLDNNATTAVDPRVVAVMTESLLSGPSNPSSQHAFGRSARGRIEAALEEIGKCIDTRFDQPGGPRLLITSGGTESNNLALGGLGEFGGGKVDAGDGTLGGGRLRDGGCGGPIIVSRIEHPSIIAVAESLEAVGRTIRWLDVDGEGEVQLDHLEELLATDHLPPALVSIMSANNETGVVQPIQRAAELCGAAGVPLHVDASQSVGKLPLNVSSLGASAVTFTAHKFHGPVGVAALWLAGGVSVRPMMHGGQQQLESRPGTEPVGLTVAMAEALRIAVEEMDQSSLHVCELRNRLELGLTSRHPNLVIHGRDKPRLPGSSCISFLGADRQSLLMALDMAGRCL